jgi:ParB/RepB/Spo0J family partition protein
METEKIKIKNLKLADNYRKSIDDSKIDELATSIKENGLLQNLVVKKVGKNYNVIAGQRRYLALLKIFTGEDEISCNIITKDADVELIAITENLQREDVDIFEEGTAIFKLYKKHKKWTQISDLVGKPPGECAKLSQLTNCSKKVQDAYKDNGITKAHCLLFAPLEKSTQDELLDEINNWNGYDNAKELKERIESSRLIIAEAPFNTEDTKLVKGAKACGSCEFNSECNTLLFDNLVTDSAICNNQKCWDLKLQGHANTTLKFLKDNHDDFIIAGGYHPKTYKDQYPEYEKHVTSLYTYECQSEQVDGAIPVFDPQDCKVLWYSKKTKVEDVKLKSDEKLDTETGEIIKMSPLEKKRGVLNRRHDKWAKQDRLETRNIVRDMIIDSGKEMIMSIELLRVVTLACMSQWRNNYEKLDDLFLDLFGKKYEKDTKAADSWKQYAIVEEYIMKETKPENLHAIIRAYYACSVHYGANVDELENTSLIDLAEVYNIKWKDVHAKLKAETDKKVESDEYEYKQQEDKIEAKYQKMLASK